MSFNQKALEQRVITQGPTRVAYPKSLCSKNTAWEHLKRRPPAGSGLKRNGVGLANNPWVKDHDVAHWAWTLTGGFPQVFDDGDDE